MKKMTDEHSKEIAEWRQTVRALTAVPLRGIQPGYVDGRTPVRIRTADAAYLALADDQVTVSSDPDERSTWILEPHGREGVVIRHAVDGSGLSVRVSRGRARLVPVTGGHPWVLRARSKGVAIVDALSLTRGWIATRRRVALGPGCGDPAELFTIGPVPA